VIVIDLFISDDDKNSGLDYINEENI